MGRVEIVTLRVGARAKEGMGGGGGRKEGKRKEKREGKDEEGGFSSLSPPPPRSLDSRHFLLSSVSTWRFHEELTFARPKKTPALQASGT